MECEYQNHNEQWFRAYGSENWEFDENGLMQKRFASINDLQIKEEETICRNDVNKTHSIPNIWTFVFKKLFA